MRGHHDATIIAQACRPPGIATQRSESGSRHARRLGASGLSQRAWEPADPPASPMAGARACPDADPMPADRDNNRSACTTVPTDTRQQGQRRNATGLTRWEVAEVVLRFYGPALVLPSPESLSQE